MPNILYYLGAPYSDPDSSIVDTRVSATNDFVVRALLQGADVISPITQSHELAKKYNLPCGWAFWKRLDLELLKRCDRMLVLMLPGWNASVGLRAEMEHAIACGIPIEFIDPKTANEWRPK